MKVSRMSFILILFIITTSYGQEANGYLTVNSVPLGMVIYLEGDSLGVTPIINYPLKPGEYTISLYPSEVIEHQYWRLAQGKFSNRLSSLWELTRIGAATKRIKITEKQVTEVFFSLKAINRAPTKAKVLIGLSSVASFAIPFLIGFLVAR
jgi:hypothetical protein